MDFFKKFITKKDKNQKQESRKEDDLKIEKKPSSLSKSLKTLKKNTSKSSFLYDSRKWYRKRYWFT